MPFDAHTLKKAARLEQSSWQLSCKADFTECFGELTVYVALVLCMIGAAGLFWRMCCRRRRSTYHKVLLGSDDSSRPADLEEGWAATSGIVDMENFGSDKPNRRRPGHQRNTSQGSMLSLDPLEDDDDDGFDVDDYASLDALEMLRKLSHEVVVKVKEVVPEMSEVQAAVHVAGHVAKLSVQTVVKPPHQPAGRRRRHSPPSLQYTKQPSMRQATRLCRASQRPTSRLASLRSRALARCCTR